MSVISEMQDKFPHIDEIESAILECWEINGLERVAERAADKYAELRRLVALLTTEPLHITRADIDAAKRILQKAEE